MGEERIRLNVAEVVPEAEDILRFELVHPEGAPLPPFEPGAHLELEIPGGFRRAYSLCNDPAERNRYVIAVQREPRGRGGSQAMHRNVVAGSTLFSSAPRSAFKLGTPERALLIAGGIGITPLLSMAYQLRREGRPFTLHCCTRSPERTAFREALRGLGASVFVHHDAGDPARGLDVRGLLERYEAGSQVFCCGPRGLMDAVRTASAGWPEGTVHFESFSGEVRAGDQPFEAVIASTGEVVPVGSDQSLLQALREKGLELASDCEAGTCGTCVLGLLEGEAEHRDACLSDAERRTHVALCPCVSRAKGKRIVLDL